MQYEIYVCGRRFVNVPSSMPVFCTFFKLCFGEENFETVGQGNECKGLKSMSCRLKYR